MPGCFEAHPKKLLVVAFPCCSQPQGKKCRAVRNLAQDAGEQVEISRSLGAFCTGRRVWTCPSLWGQFVCGSAKCLSEDKAGEWAVRAAKQSERRRERHQGELDSWKEWNKPAQCTWLHAQPLRWSAVPSCVKWVVFGGKVGYGCWKHLGNRSWKSWWDSWCEMRAGKPLGHWGRGCPAITTKRSVQFGHCLCTRFTGI